MEYKNIKEETSLMRFKQIKPLERARHKQTEPVYMGKLFDLGYQLARNGYPWDKAPPGFE